MKNSQLTKGHERRVMYIENKQGLVDGERARIGWVELSKTGRIREGNLEKGREMLDSAKLVVMADAAR
jgi:hypothetical protein